MLILISQKNLPRHPTFNSLVTQNTGIRLIRVSMHACASQSSHTSIMMLLGTLITIANYGDQQGSTYC